MAKTQKNQRTVPLTEEEKERREKLLVVLPIVISQLEENLRTGRYNCTYIDYTRGHMMFCRIHRLMLDNSQKHDAVVLPAFPLHPDYQDVNGFIMSSGIEKLSHLLRRGHTTLKLEFKKKGMILPETIDALLTEYHKPEYSKPVLPKRPSQWYSVIFTGLEAVNESQAA